MPANYEMFDHFSIKLDGSDAPNELMDQLQGVVVETDHRLPAMCTIRILDQELDWVDSSRINVGAEIEVSAQAAGDGSAVKIFDGEIVALEPEFAQSGAVMQVRAYDRGHRLHRGRNRRAFLQVTDSDLASQLAGDAGLSASSDSASGVYEHVYQDNLTNWEFLQERAQRIGYVCYMDGKTLNFKSANQTGSAIDLEWGEALSRFYPRLSSSGQVSQVQVLGWDPGAKQAITGQASSGSLSPQIGVSTKAEEVTASAFSLSQTKLVVVDRPVHTQGEADAMAKSIADELSGLYIQAEGVCVGMPTLQAGKWVNVKNIGDKFSGKYFVTRAVHTFSPDDAYTVRFSVTGRRPKSVSALVGKENSLRDSRMSGVVIGIVTNNDDPDGLGRVKVKFPWLDDDTESAWARIATPMAGAERGFQWMPEVNDEVLVAFEHDDINYPYVLGSLWNGSDKPPAGGAVESGKVVQRMIKTRVGHIILLDDSDSSPGIIIIDKTGNNKIVISSSDNKITIEADSDISIKSKQKVIVDGQMGVEISSQQKVDVKGQTGVGVEGLNVDVKGSAQVNIKGSMINLN